MFRQSALGHQLGGPEPAAAEPPGLREHRHRSGRRHHAPGRYGSRHDSLDQRWARFLHECGILPVPVPNHPETAIRMLDAVPATGVLLSGGNDLTAYGGDAPERDDTEIALVDAAARRRVPLVGVCRGMQALQHRFGTSLRRIAGHAAGPQDLVIDGRRRRVNSYHNWAATETSPPLLAWAVAADGVVKAVRHGDLPMVGIMWHPERLRPFADEDRALFRAHFEVTS